MLISMVDLCLLADGHCVRCVGKAQASCIACHGMLFIVLQLHNIANVRVLVYLVRSRNKLLAAVVSYKYRTINNTTVLYAVVHRSTCLLSGITVEAMGAFCSSAGGRQAMYESSLFAANIGTFICFTQLFACMAVVSLYSVLVLELMKGCLNV